MVILIDVPTNAEGPFHSYLDSIIQAVGALTNAYFLWQANKIVRDNSRKAEASNVVSPLYHPAIFKRYWPLTAMGAFSALLWAAILFLTSRRDSIFILAVLLLAAIVAFGFPTVASWYRRIRDDRVPQYPSPFEGTPRQLIHDMRGDPSSVTFRNGRYLLGEDEEAVTLESFSPPTAFRMIAKTNSTNLRFAYAMEEAIFNWECNLHALHILGGPFGEIDIKAAGYISPGEFATVDLVVTPNSFSIFLNGRRKFFRSGNFSAVNEPFSIFQGCLSTVEVISLLQGKPSEKVITASFGPNEIVYAEWGEGVARSRWAHRTQGGEDLSRLVKRLLVLANPVRVNSENLQAGDPAGGDTKLLRLELSSGDCYEIEERQLLSVQSAKPCDPFRPPGERINP